MKDKTYRVLLYTSAVALLILALCLQSCAVYEYGEAPSCAAYQSIELPNADCNE